MLAFCQHFRYRKLTPTEWRAVLPTRGEQCQQNAGTEGSMYNTTPHKKFLLEYHIVFPSKERRDWIETFQVKDKLKEIFSQIAQDEKVNIKALGIENDHVHVHISTLPAFNLTKFMQVLKGKSSYLIKKIYPQLKDLPYPLWTKGYFASTTGPPSWLIQEYIRNQDLHHKKYHFSGQTFPKKF